MQVIGFVGIKGAGKTYLANYLIRKYGFVRIAFGDALKDFLRTCFYVVLAKTKDEEERYYKQINYNVLRTEVDDPGFWKWVKQISTYLSMNLNPYGTDMVEFQSLLREYYAQSSLKEKKEYARRILQFFGTEIARTRNPNIWVEKLDEKVRQFLRVGGKIVIDDIRFPNEFSYVKEILPSRYDVRSFTVGIEPDETIYNKKIANRVGQGIKKHKSETSIPELLKKCDAVIVNHYDKATIYEFEDLLRNKDTGFCVNYQADPSISPAFEKGRW